MSWQNNLRTQGYAHFTNLVPENLINEARQAIETDISTNYQTERQTEYNNRSFCPDLLGTVPIMNLINNEPVQKILDTALGLDKIDWDKGQIAIRQAHNHHEPVSPEPHIDGFSNGFNGLTDGKIYNHTVLVGIFLTPVVREFAGNFTVWNGSQDIYEKYFQERGERAIHEPMPTPEIGQPTQLLCDAGDVVIAHYQLGHAAAVNTSDNDRIAVYFRVWLRGLEQERWRYLTNIWEGWKI